MSAAGAVLAWGALAIWAGAVPLPGTTSVAVALASPSDCHDCHGTFDPEKDAYDTWIGSAMANSARNPLFLSALTEAEKDSPPIGDLCLRCHAPDAWLGGRCAAVDGSLLTPDDTGTTCAVCHRMEPSSWKRNGQFALAEDRIYRAEYTDSMASHDVAGSSWFEDPAFCAPCHDLRNPLVVWNGHAPMGFPEQSTFTEWATSAFATPSVKKTCQDCHLPTSMGKADERGPVRASRSAHDLAGGNVFLLGAIAFLEPGLGISEQLTRGQTRNQAMLQQAATIEAASPPLAIARGTTIALRFRVTNLAGHKLPTGYPEGRRVWVRIESNELDLHLGVFDALTEAPANAPAIYETKQGVAAMNAPGHRLAINDTIYFDSRIPPKGMVVTATTAPVGKTFAEVSPGVLANWDDLTITATVGCDLAKDARVHASLLYQSVTKAYVDALVAENGADPRGERLRLAFENADPGPFEMASADLLLPIDGASSACGVDAGVPDAEAPIDAAGRDAAIEMPAMRRGCACTESGTCPGGLPLDILLGLFCVRAFSRRRAPWWVALALLSCGKAAPPLIVETASLPDVKLGAAYDQRLEVVGGTPPYAFAIASGALPNGIDLSLTTGQLVGVAGTPGHAKFTVRVSDAEKKSVTADLVLYVVPEALSIATAPLPEGQEGTRYDRALVATGGVPPLSWSKMSGALPQGLDVTADGHIAGTPSEFGSFDFLAGVMDAESMSASATLHLTVTSLNPMIGTTSVASARVGQPYSAVLSATGGTPPYTWSIASGRAPAGVALSKDGLLAGTPTESGDFMLAIQVVDGGGRMDMKDEMLHVIAPLAITTASLPQIVRDRAYDQTLQATGGEAPYTWSLEQVGGLPPGLALETSGRIHGTTAMLGDFMIVVRVEDAGGFVKAAEFALHVGDRFTYTTTTSPVMIPPVCSSTIVSYRTIALDVPDSYQIADVQVAVKVTWPGMNNPLRVVLWSPDGIEALLCGNGANDGSSTNSGGHTCTTPYIAVDSGGVDQTFSDASPATTDHPDTPLLTFKGTNPQGRWKLSVGVAAPTCAIMGTIDSFTLSVKDEASTSPYILVKGFTKNNLVIEPMLRICSATPPPNASCAAIDEHQLFLSATAYGVGANGFPEGGKGDDVPMPAALTWAWSGASIPEVELLPDGRITAGSQTGKASINVSGNGLSVSFMLRVVPPKWNPIFRGF
jgi:subtilisin-like proprotein convertase family protein